MNKTTLLFAFIAGGAIGSLAAAFGTKKYFEKMANDRADSEIESMKEMLRKKEERIEAITNEKVEKRAYEIISERYSKTDDQKISEKKKESKEETAMDERPYVIDPEEYGDLGYKQVSLNYYDDGVLTYENDDVIENVDELVGKDSLTHFGEYEDDTVYVRNDVLRTDFEILADTRRYADIYC